MSTRRPRCRCFVACGRLSDDGLDSLMRQWWNVCIPGRAGGGGYIAQRMLSAKDEKNVVVPRCSSTSCTTHAPWPWIIVALVRWSSSVMPPPSRRPRAPGWPRTRRRFSNETAKESMPDEARVQVASARPRRPAVVWRVPLLDDQFRQRHCLPRHDSTMPKGWLGLGVVDCGLYVHHRDASQLGAHPTVQDFTRVSSILTSRRRRRSPSGHDVGIAGVSGLVAL